MSIKSKLIKIFDLIIFWAEENRIFSFVLIVLLSIAVMFGVTYWYKENYGVSVQNRITFISVTLLFLIFLLLLAISLQRKAVNDRFNWILGVVNNLSLKIDGLQQSEKDGAEEKSITTKWPWGTHNTKDLEHLAAAANRFWTLYDPSDFTTAPTNKVVADWLVTNRGVARDRANYMASILRADGLPDGPRR